MRANLSKPQGGHKRAVLRTAVTLSAAVALSALAPPGVRAIGESSLFDVRSVVYDGGNPHPRETAPRRLAWEVRKRTSVATRLEPSEVRLDDPSIFTTPFLYWSGDEAFDPLSDVELSGLRRFVRFGGFVLVDDASPERRGFDESVRRDLGRAFPRRSLGALSPSHTLYRSFYLLRRPVGRVRGPGSLDAIEVGDRVAVLYSRHDLGGAWARDNLGSWEHTVTPGGDEQRERAIRLGVNAVLYALCLDYKDDQVHAPFLIRRGSPTRELSRSRFVPRLRCTGGGATAILLAIGLSALAGWGVWSLRGVADQQRRTVLMGLRVLTAVLAWLVAVQPRWVEERVQRSEGRLALLVDASRSLGLPRGDDARASRVEAMLSRWQGERPVAAFTFAEELEASDLARLAESLPAIGDQSRLVPSLAALLEREEGRDLGGVVVVSDGADGMTGGLEDVVRAGVRVHAVAVGEPDLRDDSILRLEADPVAFLRRSGRVRVAIRSTGGSGGPIPVTLRRGEQLVREVIAEPGPDGTAEVELPFTPERLGRAVYSVSIPRAPGDAVPENNERAFLVRVTRDKLRVLLVAGQPSWDERFLRSFLKRDPATDLICFFILRNTSDLTMAGPDELALIPFPTDELFNEHLGSFDVVLFQNFEYGPYQMAGYLPRIRDYVLRGGSFAMIGGPLSFGSGDYANTPVAEVLPVTLPPADAPDEQLLDTQPFTPRLMTGLERHPLVAMVPDPADNLRAWSELAPLQGANVVRGVRPGATVLLEHPTARSGGRPLPILVTGTAGRGRTLAFTTDTSWRWGMTTGGLRGDSSAYERFWDRGLRWLSGTRRSSRRWSAPTGSRTGRGRPCGPARASPTTATRRTRTGR